MEDAVGSPLRVITSLRSRSTKLHSHKGLIQDRPSPVLATCIPRRGNPIFTQSAAGSCSYPAVTRATEKPDFSFVITSSKARVAGLQYALPKSADSKSRDDRPRLEIPG